MPADPHRPRPAGIRLVIAYKLLKGVVMITLAILLTFARHDALLAAERFARDLTYGAPIWRRLGLWLQAHLTPGIATLGAILAWFDGAISLAAVTLLVLGKPWAEWIVVVGLSALLPLEVLAVAQRPTAIRVIVLVGNAAVVVYLARRRLGRARR